jgi:hypothetical protein
MISIIKETSLYNYIMQWGIAGFSDSILSYVNNNIIKEGDTDELRNN